MTIGLACGVRQLFPILLSLVFCGVWLLLHPSLPGCEGGAVARPPPDDWLSPEQAKALQTENTQLSLELEKAKEELQKFNSTYGQVVSAYAAAKEQLDSTTEMLPLESHNTCGAPSSLVATSGRVYCGDVSLELGRARDFAHCQLACAMNSSCEFYSYWSSGRRTRLCRITSSCDHKVNVKELNEHVQIYQRVVPVSSKRSLLQLLGMYDSGTNLMLATIVSNFPLCCQQAYRPDIMDLQIEAQDHGRCLHWATPEKHVNPLQMLDALKGQKMKHWDPKLVDFQQKHQIAIVALVRDPLAQLQSWKKAPYGLERCAKRKRCAFHSTATDCIPTTAWITEPCTWWDPARHHNAGITGGSFPSLPAIWNGYTLGYWRLRAESGYKQVLLVKFEELVMAPAAVVSRISEAMDMRVHSEDVAVAERAAKAHGKAKDRNAAIKSLESRDFVKSYTAKELKATCIRLNFSLASSVGYRLTECEDFKGEAKLEEPYSDTQAVAEAKQDITLPEEKKAQLLRFQSRRAKRFPSKVLKPRRRPTR
ncbi:unnamed protein product [Durusdinium trenchii]|uniref:Uncharacterized protein n=2 Tax=Durusdinium trenchii TaxID=1381693 RepID=A0ABP0KKE5_9DINO